MNVSSVFFDASLYFLLCNNATIPINSAPIAPMYEPIKENHADLSNLMGNENGKMVSLKSIISIKKGRKIIAIKPKKTMINIDNVLSFFS